MIAVQQPWQLLGQDTTLDKPLSDACRKILRKRELVRDMDADAFLL